MAIYFKRGFSSKIKSKVTEADIARFSEWESKVYKFLNTDDNLFGCTMRPTTDYNQVDQLN